MNHELMLEPRKMLSGKLIFHELLLWQAFEFYGGVAVAVVAIPLGMSDVERKIIKPSVKIW